jgi:hypothetical protein
MANDWKRYAISVAAVLSGLCCSAWLLGSGQASLRLEPIAGDAFYAVPPDSATLLGFHARTAERAGFQVDYQITDYAGKPIKHGSVPLSHAKLAVSVQLPEGYYELSFANTEASFGFTVAPRFEGAADPFFGLDTALSWLVGEQAKRQALIRALKKVGIGMARERLGWMLVEPNLGRWDWNAKHNYDAVRRIYRDNGIKLLECLYGMPGSVKLDRDPDKLESERYVRSMAQLAQRWGDVWGAVEVWNEIDLADVDPKRYVRALQVVQQGIAGRSPEIPVVAGAFARFREDYLDRLADAGMLKYADALSIHPYGSSRDTREMLESYRRWVAKRGRPGLPIWISESGRAWPRGPARPAQVDDARSAKANTIRGVLARSASATAYFPFVYTFFEEKELNYGMTDRAFTPLRSFAAYATLIRMLAHATPLALPAIPGAKEAYAFAREGKRVWVVYTDEAAQLAAPRGIHGRVYGMDGRDLGLIRGKIPVPDGLSYVLSEN